MYFFIFTPNNSGSTIMSQYLAAQANAYISPYTNSEGQFIPSVKEIMRYKPWDPDHDFDWSVIRHSWNIELERSGKEIFVEGTPGNMLRVDSILKEFPSDTQYVFSISSPYLYVASVLRNFSKTSAKEEIIKRTNEWLFRADVQKRNIEKFSNGVYITYEGFCQDPLILNAAFNLPKNLDSESEVKGKNITQISHIIDLTAKSVSFYSYSEILVINKVLKTRPDLLEYFDYEIMNLEAINDLMKDNMVLSNSGVIDRVLFEKKNTKFCVDVDKFPLKRLIKSRFHKFFRKSMW